MHESDSDDEDLDGSAINHSARGNGIASRVKLEQMGGDADAVLGLSRLKHGAALDRDGLTRNAMSLAIQQLMGPAMMAGGATPWTPPIMPPASPGSLSINASATGGSAGAATQVISSSSPGGGSGSSGNSGNSGSHLEAGKGYTFEEQFKQVRI